MSNGLMKEMTAYCLIDCDESICVAERGGLTVDIQSTAG